MPFICLANANVPDGVLQITDLFPNVSQNNNPTNSPGQTRYLRRPGSDIASVDSQSGLVVGSGADASLPQFDGLAAYLLDRVEVGRDGVAEATVTLAGVQALDTLTIKGIWFQFAAGVNDLAGKAGTMGDPFIVGLGADDNAAAANLTSALNDAADVGAAMDVPAPVNIHTVGTNIGAPSPVVQIQPEDGGAALVTGSDGQFTIVSSNSGRITIDTASFTVGRLVRSFERWDPTTLAAAATAIQNLVDTGAACTLAAVDAALATYDADLSGATVGGSSSTGTLTELLQVLAGRTYRVARGVSKFTAVASPDTVSVWDATQRGSFTVANSTWDTDMLSGEWGATTAGVAKIKTGGSLTAPTFSGGGDVVNNDIGGARNTYDSTHFQASVQNGQLAQYAAGVTLFPDAEVQAFKARRHPNGLPALARQATLLNQRLVTVYDDDGTLLV